MIRTSFSTACIVVLFMAAPSGAADWPQWLGPNRDSVWSEKGIVQKFPEGGLKAKWRVPVQGGYSGPAVAGNRVYLTDYARLAGVVVNAPGERNQLQGQERVLCISATTGETLWKHEYNCPYSISYAAGPRCTPTVEGGRVYALGAEGNLLSLAADSGSVVWSKDLKKEYKVQTPIWGFCGHPLVDGNKLICLVGGEGSVAVAFDKSSGKELWRALTASEPGYCPPSIIEAGGKRQLLIWDADKLNSLNPETGELYWSIDLKPAYGMSITAPRKSGDYLFASAIGDVGAVLQLDRQKPAAEIVWRGNVKNAVYCANSTPFLEDGIVYGCDCQVGVLRGVELATGNRLWETFAPTTGGTRRASHGTAFIVKHEDRFFLFAETGDLIIARLSPQGYEEISRMHVLEPTQECFGRSVIWSHPAFANQCLFARNDKELVCVSLAAE